MEHDKILKNLVIILINNKMVEFQGQILLNCRFDYSCGLPWTSLTVTELLLLSSVFSKEGEFL